MATKKKTVRVLSFVIALVMIFTVVPLGAFAAEESETLLIKNGTAIIKDDMTEAQVKEAVFNALAANPQGKNPQDYEWEYYCKGNHTVFGTLDNPTWGSVNGFKSEKKIALTMHYYNHKALKDNVDGEWAVRLKGGETEVILNKKSEAELPKAEIIIDEGEKHPTLYFKEDTSYDYERLKSDIFALAVKEIKNVPAEIGRENFTFEFLLSDGMAVNTFVPFETRKYGIDAAEVIYNYLYKGGERKIRITLPDGDGYTGAYAEFTVNLKVYGREEANVVLKEGAAFKYNKNYEKMKEDIFNNVIDWPSSSLPSKENLTAENFTFEYYASDVLAGGTEGLIKRWVPFEGETVIGMAKFPPIGAGEKQIRVTYKGGSTHNSGKGGETLAVVEKAKTKVYVHSTNKFFDEDLPQNFVTTSVQDDFKFYNIYIGTSSSFVTTIYIDVPGISDNGLLKIFDPVVRLVLGRSVEDVMKNGLTLGEIKNLINSEALLDLLDVFGVDTSSVRAVIDVIEKLPNTVEKVKIGLDEPYTAGVYTVISLAVNPNYETGVGLGSVVVKMRSRGVKLHYNNIISAPIKRSDAQIFDFDAQVTRDGVPVDAENIRYIYSGVTAKGRIYYSTKTPPREPGMYTQTAWTFGGGYYAFPVTRTYRIVKDA